MELIIGPSSELPKHKPGYVVVASGSKGIVSLSSSPRLTWGERIFGAYSQYYNVYTGTTTISIPPFDCSSSVPGIDFNVSIDISVQIIDPVRAVREDMSDLTLLMQQPVRVAAEAVTHKHGLESMPHVKVGIQTSVAQINLDRAVRVSGVVATVTLDTRAKELLRKIGEERISIKADEAQSRVDAARREKILAMLDSPNELLAHSMVTKDADFRDAFNIKLGEMNDRKQDQINLLKWALEKNIIEPHDIHEKYKTILDFALSSIGGPASDAVSSGVIAQGTNFISGKEKE